MKNVLKVLALIFVAALLFSITKMVMIATADETPGPIRNPLIFYTFVSFISSIVLILVSRLMISNESSAYQNEIEELKESINQKEAHLSSQESKMMQMEEGNRFALMIADFAALMQASSDLKVLTENVITKLCTELDASQGAFFIKYDNGGINNLRLISGYAYHIAESSEVTFEFGEGLAGQVAKEGKIYNFDSVPEGYVQILSGLGESTPKHLIILPLINDEEVLGVIEIASFKAFNEGHVEFLNKLSSLFGAGLRRIINEGRTENVNLINGIKEVQQEVGKGKFVGNSSSDNVSTSNENSISTNTPEANPSTENPE